VDSLYLQNIGLKGQEAFFRNREPSTISRPKKIT
jgi:hypothetical protein